jgi:hypothetical protein
MGQQILILALTGTHNPALPTDLTQQLAAKGLQIRHACLSYQGHTTFAVGTADELKLELAEAGHPHDIIGETAATAPEGVTLETVLETVLEEVRALHEAFRKITSAGKESKPRGKKEAPAAPASTGTEGTETGTAAPDDNPPPSTGTAPQPDPHQPTGNEDI